ncbi:hypothetical protein VTO73DRAFT_10679 [Trametes versicolor]
MGPEPLCTHTSFVDRLFPPLAKRKNPSSDDSPDGPSGDVSDELSLAEQQRRGKRIRTRSKKREALDDDEHTKNKKLIAKLMRQNAKLTAQITADDMQDMSGSNDDEYESEEDQEDVVEARQAQDTFQSRGIFHASQPVGRLRREGDPGGPSQSNLAEPSSNTKSPDNGFVVTSGGSASRPGGSHSSEASVPAHLSESAPPYAQTSGQAVSTAGPSQGVGNCGQVIARPSQVAVTAASSSADLALTPGEATEKEPPFRNSQIPTGDPKSADYEPHVNKMIVKACHHFEALVCTEDAFPDPTVQKDWAIAVWARACQDVRIPYKLTDRVQKLITERTSHARGSLKDRIRPHIALTYGLSLETGEDARSCNKARIALLTDSDALEPEPVFHYKDVDNVSEFAHNKIVHIVIQDEWFRDADSVGLRFPELFSPIREVTLAIVFTAIHFCLDQWAKGTYQSGGKFSEKAYKEKYESHLRKIRDWSGIDTTLTCKLRQRLHDRAREASGATPVRASAAGLSTVTRDRLQAELEAQARALEDE